MSKYSRNRHNKIHLIRRWNHYFLDSPPAPKFDYTPWCSDLKIPHSDILSMAVEYNKFIKLPRSAQCLNCINAHPDGRMRNYCAEQNHIISVEILCAALSSFGA